MVQNEASGNLPKILADRVQLQQVILNLVMNAAEAMAAAGDQRRRLRLTARIEDPDTLAITVEDTGPGFDPMNVDRIFDPLFTTKSNGMGMGLSISRSIIQAHEGCLSASSGMGGGSVFTISLPICGGADST